MAGKRNLSSSSTTMVNTSKRRRFSSSKYSFLQNPKPDWSQLQPELVELIISKLSFMQILRFKAVCSSWYSIAESFVSSSRFTPSSETPLLLLPRGPEDDTDSRCFFSLEDKKIKHLGDGFGDDSWCIGSSHGWLVLLDDEAKPFLLNPFSQARIELPSLDPFMSDAIRESYFINMLRKSFITKAVLLSDPSHAKHYGVVLIYGHLERLAFFKKGDATWTLLDDADSARYCDIIYCNDLLYALTDNNHIQIWDFHASLPIKKQEIHPATPGKMVTESFRKLHFSRCYLVESCGDLLLLVRIVGNFVNHEGEPVDESRLLSDEDTHPLVFPYRTLSFDVYKLVSRGKKWVEVENLNNQALFVGGNESMSVSAQDFSGCERNCIYFTDDNWVQMNEDYLYGGHDFGKFSLEEKVVRPIFQCDSDRIDPPPFWIVPNPW